MNPLYPVCAALAVALALYLVYALWRAEDF
ncbi:MAG: K(+)-transporting ATPase subunit F [Methyloversatilis sp.]|uniref:Uncharacterized protein n=1 Tax=Methyloversatilis universalis (strain ATCC BAA-1314 / DSM 25237 / JCM 13912 / CCUG 52030 / FAM5) TaxID=1000565 RepID=F5R7Q3_METUF|nr:K(+)-transporting ATPase subunit F [Methyloversatilis universalis]EGK73620.1 hypothetical protein METUNv1_00251 [Methyloversatilis universalis FAM5]MCP4637481.1 K(+)-transporting ATPase subunit F [Methyloversatilis sp.]